MVDRFQCIPLSKVLVGCLFDLSGFWQGRHWVADKISAEKTNP